MSHVGLRTRWIVHAIKCDEGEKYERYFAIAYLPLSTPSLGITPC